VTSVGPPNLASRGAIQAAQQETRLICVSHCEGRANCTMGAWLKGSIQPTKQTGLHYGSLGKALCSLPITPQVTSLQTGGSCIPKLDYK